MRVALLIGRNVRLFTREEGPGLDWQTHEIGEIQGDRRVDRLGE